MKENSFIKNTSWIIGGRIFQIIISLAISMLTARYLGPSNYGLISYAASFSAFFYSICTLGLTNIAVNELINNRKQEGAILGTSIFLRILAGFFSIITILSLVTILNPGERITLIVTFLYSLALIFQSFDTLNYWYQSKMLSKYPTIATSIGYVVVAIYKIILLINKKTIVWFAFSTSLDLIIVAIFLILLYKKNKGPKLEIDLKLGKTLLKKSYHFILSGLMVAIYAQTDKLMLKQMIDTSAVGYYATATVISGLWVFVLAAIIDSARPLIIKNRETNYKEYENKIISLYSVLIYLSFSAAILITIFARPFILILYGEAYLQAVVPLRIITWYSAFSYLGVARSIWLVAEGKQKYEKLLAGAGAVTNVFLNIVLIRTWGISGAAVATLSTQIVTNFLIGFFIKPVRINSIYILKSFNPKYLVAYGRKLLIGLKVDR